MTREEAIKQLESLLAHCESMRSDDDLIWGDECDALKIALSALRPVSREQVEKVRGEWKPGDPVCTVCGRNKFSGLDADIWADWMPSFCPHCGAPMTDEAVQMVMERLEALKDADD